VEYSAPSAAVGAAPLIAAAKFSEMVTWRAARGSTATVHSYGW
jgi:hypothetical protein